LLVKVSCIKILLNHLFNCGKDTKNILNKEQYLTNLFYICIKFSISKYENHIAHYNFNGTGGIAIGSENFFHQKWQVPAHPHSWQQRDAKTQHLVCSRRRFFKLEALILHFIDNK